MSQPSTKDPQNSLAIIGRLLAMSWQYRRECLTVLGFQVVLLGMGLTGLGLSGVGIDVLRRELQPEAPAPRWPLGFSPPPGTGALATVVGIGAVILAMAAIRAVFNYYYTISVGRLVQLDIVPTMRGRVYDKLQRLSFRFFDANASGSLINRVTGDVQLLRSFVDGVLIQSIIMLLSLSVYLVYMLSKHVMLTLACLVTMPLVWTATTIFSRLVQPAYRKNRDLVDAMVLELSEGVQGIQVTKSFGREVEANGRFSDKTSAVSNQQERLFWRVSVYSPVVDFLGQSNLLMLLGYGGFLVARRALSLGDLIVFAGLLQQFSTQVTNMAGVVNTIQQSLIGARRVFEVLDAPIEITSPKEPVRAPKTRGAIAFEGVDFGYAPGQVALSGITFDARPGQCIAIVGSTGSGKSTLLGLIPRFYDPTAGRILLDGIDLRRYDVDELRRKIGLVFQESFLFSNTVAANIAFGSPDASRDQIERAAKIAAAHRFVQELPKGYDTILSESGNNLSGGQRQRLAIARALLPDPPVLLLDDPTASVDPETEQEILTAMNEAMSGRTTFVVTHRISTLRRADLILVLEDGVIVERGTHDELMKKGGHYLHTATLQGAIDDAEDRLGQLGS